MINPKYAKPLRKLAQQQKKICLNSKSLKNVSNPSLYCNIVLATLLDKSDLNSLLSIEEIIFNTEVDLIKSTCLTEYWFWTITSAACIIREDNAVQKAINIVSLYTPPLPGIVNNAEAIAFQVSFGYLIWDAINQIVIKNKIFSNYFISVV